MRGSQGVMVSTTHTVAPRFGKRASARSWSALKSAVPNFLGQSATALAPLPRFTWSSVKPFPGTQGAMRPMTCPAATD